MSRQVERVKYGSHGQGSLVKFDDSPNWFSCYSVKGKEHSESTETADFKKARRFHKQKLDEIAADRQGLRKFVAPVQHRMLVGELLDDLKADIELRGLKSARKVQYHAKPIEEHFGKMRAVDVGADVVDRYVKAKLAAGKSNGTVNRGTQILGAALKLAVERGKLTTAPMIRKLPERNVRRVFYERAEFETLLKHLPEYLQDAARFAYLTGWRKSEVVGLRWEWVDRAEGTITLPTTKNGQGRTLHLAGELVDIIKRRESARLVEVPDGPESTTVKVADLVFHRKARTLGDFKRAWHAALTAAGLSHQEKQPDGTTHTVYDRSFHDFRRTAARNLVRADVREGVAMSITGHRTRSVFDRYNITSAEDQRAAMERATVYVRGQSTK